MVLFRGETPAARISNSQDVDLQKVVANLNWVLNTKRGYGSILTDFGISDLNECTSRDVLILKIMEEVKRNIELYEPRLQLINIAVKDNKDVFRISFDINCILKDTRKALVMEFNSVYNNFNIKNPAGGNADV
jgi:type VI secretion system lysozyme-like protein